MKHKVMFGLQVFTTLILIVTIFISYLISGTKAETGNGEMVSGTKIEKGADLPGIVGGSFTTTLNSIISCGEFVSGQ